MMISNHIIKSLFKWSIYTFLFILSGVLILQLSFVLLEKRDAIFSLANFFDGAGSYFHLFRLSVAFLIVYYWEHLVLFVCSKNNYGDQELKTLLGCRLYFICALFLLETLGFLF